MRLFNFKFIPSFFVSVFLYTQPFVIYASDIDDSLRDETLSIKMDILTQNVPEHLHRAAFSVVRFINPKWLAWYLMMALGADTPVIEALAYSMNLPTPQDVRAFYAFVQKNPELDLGFEPPVSQSVRAIAEKYNRGYPILYLWGKEMTFLPRNLWALLDVLKPTFAHNNFTDIEPLVYFTQIKSLNLDSTPVADIKPLAGMLRLKYLDLSNTQVCDLEPLRGLSSLQTLLLTNAKVRDIKPIEILTNLQHLSLTRNIIIDANPLRALINLEKLYLNATGITDLRVLLHLPLLQMLYIACNPIEDVKDLANLLSLKVCGIFKTPATNTLEKNASIQKLFKTDVTLYLTDNIHEVKGTKGEPPL